MNDSCDQSLVLLGMDFPDCCMLEIAFAVGRALWHSLLRRVHPSWSAWYRKVITPYERRALEQEDYFSDQLRQWHPSIPYAFVLCRRSHSSLEGGSETSPCALTCQKRYIHFTSVSAYPRSCDSFANVANEPLLSLIHI